MISLPIYLDNSATTPPDPLVVDAMLPYLYKHYGNAASLQHSYGWAASEAVNVAREQVAALIHAEPQEIVFTSGSTESINLAIKGCMEAYHRKGNHLITVSTEHKAVLDTCEHLEKQGVAVTYLSVDENGQIDLAALENAIRPETVMMAIMYANNETGIIQDIPAIGKIAKNNKVIFFCDATQAVGKVKVNVLEDNIDMLSLSAHKIYGPKGVGALYVRRKNPRVTLIEQMNGGGHERHMRSGTSNVPSIVGLGKACELAIQKMEEESLLLTKMRDQLEVAILENIGNTHVNGIGLRLPHISNISFMEPISSQLLSAFRSTLAVSAGSACTSASNDPSYVLMAMGLGEQRAKSAIRFSLGRFTTKEEIDFAIQFLLQTIPSLRMEEF
ncbi:MAG: IscS subfamily cysteine desulfurase [Pseudopedobacter saltans]|uniref:cysteine desulfurase n=1 Tax=Pseudopedobacter saltans TaxID=151895 RepID=A0A2W5EVV2_9SPHI|nr:MAG: IscS subfamily cysteine desulfurase [Pseudopedobacter saltans]